MIFTGQTERSIDEKSRISLPTKMREGFPAGIVYASPGFNDSIWLSPEIVFEEQLRKLGASSLPEESVMELKQILYSQSQRVELDKQGRIRLPENLLHLSDIGKQAFILGVGDHLEVLDQTKWTEQLEKKLPNFHDIMKRART